MIAGILFFILNFWLELIQEYILFHKCICHFVKGFYILSDPSEKTLDYFCLNFIFYSDFSNLLKNMSHFVFLLYVVCKTDWYNFPCASLSLQLNIYSYFCSRVFIFVFAQILIIICSASYLDIFSIKTWKYFFPICFSWWDSFLSIAT